ncbi:MAG: purine-nucleoside phosphorylase [Propionicimonas sp.]
MAHLLAAQALLTRFELPSIDIALILGSGWSGASVGLGEIIGECDLAELPGFNKPVVAGHAGMLRIIRTGNGKIAALFSGRTHYYEGRGVEPVVHAVRTAAAAGATSVVLTNGCGGLVTEWPPGTVVVLRDHINLTGATPLVGATFIDMTEAYSPRLRSIIHEVDASLPEGVYVQFHGPQYETPAEVRMAKALGGDLVGMSTALETIAAREVGVEVLGLSLVTNFGAGISPTPLAHEEVVAAGTAAEPRLRALLAGLLERI